jgi:hypothetical protein
VEARFKIFPEQDWLFGVPRSPKETPMNRRYELPFTRENRPWLTSDCIESMNEQFMDCLSKIPEQHRDALRSWAAIKVEMGACRDKPEVMERCHRWGEQWVREQLEQGVIH